MIREQANGSDLMVMCYTSNDFCQGLETFMSKRTLVWTGM